MTSLSHPSLVGEHPADHKPPRRRRSKFFPKALRYKWEAYCNTNGGAYCDTNGGRTDSVSLSSERRGTKTTAIQIGGVLQYKLEVYCDTFLRGTLRAKGTLISEPRFSTPCETRFFPREKGKTAFSKKNPRQRPFSLSRVGKNRISQGVEDRGSLISAPLALRVVVVGVF